MRTIALRWIIRRTHPRYKVVSGNEHAPGSGRLDRRRLHGRRSGVYLAMSFNS